MSDHRASVRLAIVNVALAAMLATSLFLLVRESHAHPWMDMHWHDTSVPWAWQSGYTGNRGQGEAALNDWDRNTDINFRSVSESQAKVTLATSNYGATGWGGLAQASYSQNKSGGHPYNDIGSCKAMLNTHYEKPVWFAFQSEDDYRQAVFCQEIGHCLGLDHSNDGCMGVSYYWFNAEKGTNQHNRDDINRAH